MGEHRMIQELQRRALLQPQRLHDGQDALNKTATCVAMTAKCVLPPQYSRAQQTLHVIVGWLDTVLVEKGPQSWLEFKQVSAQRGGFRIAAARTFLQPTPHGLAERLQFALQYRAASAAAKQMPFVKQNLHRPKPQFAIFLGRAAAVHQFLEVPFQMGPTQLPQAGLQPAVYRPAITGNDALDVLAQQGSQAQGTAGGSNDKAGHCGRGRTPQ